MLRELYETDEDLKTKVKAAYEEGLTANKTCGGCGSPMPDHRIRIEAGNSLMAQIYGKPAQNVEGNHAVTITVLSRTLAALEEPDVASSKGEVIEYAELQASPESSSQAS